METGLGKEDCEAIARSVFEDHAANRPFLPFAEERGIRNLADAYAVQREYVELRKGRTSARQAGYKIGLTSKKMQAMCGIDSPVAGIVLSDGIRASPTIIDGRAFGHFGLEFEIAVRLARDVPPSDSPISVPEIAKAVAGVAAAVELVDDRGCDYARLEPLSLVADNAWNAGIVHGEFKAQWPHLLEVEAVAHADGVEIGRGVGRDVLGHPFAALAWLANHLAGQIDHLRAGDIVMTGSIIPTQFPRKTTDFVYRVAGLGEVSCRVVF